MTTPAEQRLRWLVTALDDPSRLVPADIEVVFDASGFWDDWSPAGELEFLRMGPHRGSRPLSLERVTRNGDHEATATLAGGDGKRWAVTCWVEDEKPHRIRGARTVPAPPDGLDIRLASPSDAAVLAELERRAPLRLGTSPLTFMTFDHGQDYFAPSRLMEEVTIYVAEAEGRVCGVYCGAVQPVEIDGQAKRLFLEHHVRIDPDAPRGGVFWALCAFGRDRYARSTDSIAFYVSVDNHAVRKFVTGVLPWSVQPLRALLPCRADLAASDAGRPASADDGEEIVDALNDSHAGSALYVPYTPVSLGARLCRDPVQYTWSDFRLLGGAAIGIGSELLGVTKQCQDRAQVSRRAVALDHGFVAGHEEDYATLLRSRCSELAGLGATHLAVFTSERSSTYDVVSSLAEEIEPFDFWAVDIPEPTALTRRGFYVDPVYF